MIFQHATTGSNSVFPFQAKLRHRNSAGMRRWPRVAGASELEFRSERKCNDFSWKERGNRGKLENTCAGGKQGSLGRFSNTHVVGKRHHGPDEKLERTQMLYVCPRAHRQSLRRQVCGRRVVMNQSCLVSVASGGVQPRR